MTRLNKFDAEALMNSYDADPQAALAVALATVLDRPGAAWPELVHLAPLDEQRKQALLSGSQAALDDLARELNELRTL